jgi:hypothetical protein
MAKRAKLQTSRRLPVREEKRPSGFDLPRAQPVSAPVKRQEPVRSVPIKQAPAPTMTRPLANDPISTGLMRPLVSTAPVAKSPVKAIAPSLAGPVKKETPEEAIVGLGDFFSQQQGQSRALADMAAESGDYSGLDKSVDISRITQNPLGALDDYFEEKVDDNLVEYVEENEIPAFIEKEDGTKVFLNTGTQTSIARVAGEEHQGSEGRYEASGPVGTYSAEWKLTENPLNNPVVSIAAGFVPGGTLVLQGMRAASGEKLTATDILSAGLDGLKATGMLQAPQSAAAASSAGETARRAALDSGAAFGDAVSASRAAEAAALAGKGLGGLSYAQTVGLMNAAASGNPLGAVMGYYGPQILEGTIGQMGSAGTDFANKLNIQPDDFNAGLNRTISSMASGSSFKDALRSGFVEYIKEGGSLGDWDNILKDSNINLGPIEDAIRWAGSKLEDGARAVGSLIDDATWEQVKDIKVPGEFTVPEEIKAAGRQVEDVARTIGSTAEDVTRTVGSAVDDVIIQPARTVLKEADDTFVQPAGEAFSALDTAVREVAPGIEDFVRDVVNPLDNFVDDIGLPDIGLGLPDLGGVLGGLALMPQPATATTNKIFDNELFKFKTEIGITDRDALIDIEDFLTSPFESSFAQTGRF